MSVTKLVELEKSCSVVVTGAGHVRTQKRSVSPVHDVCGQLIAKSALVFYAVRRRPDPQMVVRENMGSEIVVNNLAAGPGLAQLADFLSGRRRRLLGRCDWCCRLRRGSAPLGGGKDSGGSM
jgi:hypothetical protein